MWIMGFLHRWKRGWHGRGDWYLGGHSSLQPTILSVPHIPSQPSCCTNPVLLTSCTVGNEVPKALWAHPGALHKVEMARVWARAQQKFDSCPPFCTPFWRKSQGPPRPWDKPPGSNPSPQAVLLLSWMSDLCPHSVKPRKSISSLYVLPVLSPKLLEVTLAPQVCVM